jgi:hypothetical protein
MLPVAPRWALTTAASRASRENSFHGFRMKLIRFAES